MSELLKINVNDHTEKKNGLTYLSWAWAWAEVLKHDPEATWVAHTYGPQGSEEPCMRVGKTAMVHVSVTIKGMRRECMLPVMDHRNKAIADPDAFAVNTAIMRCLAKAIAMHGLGLYIYAGEDLPESDEPTQEQPTKVRGVKILPTDGAGDSLTPERRSELDEFTLNLIDLKVAGRSLDAIAQYYSLDDNDEKVYVWKQLAAESAFRREIKANSPHRKEAA